MLEGLAERIEIYGTAECLFGTPGLKTGDERLCELLRAAGAAAEVNFYSGEVDAFEEGGYCCLVSLAAGKAYGVDAFAKHFYCLGICGLGVGSLYFLAAEPVVVGACASHVGIFAGKRVCGLKPFDILRTIHRLKTKTFVSAPDQLFVKGHAFEVGLHFGFPLGGGHRRKLVKQFFFLFCHG